MDGAGLRKFWDQCNCKFGGDTYAQSKTDKADKSEDVDENCKIVQRIIYRTSERDAL
jgi:hypothetical protein